MLERPRRSASKRLLVLGLVLVLHSHVVNAETAYYQKIEDASPGSLSLDVVLESLAQKQLKDVPFKETQINPLLEGEQVSYGTLIYDRQLRSLIKAIAEPEAISFSMNEEQVILSQEGRTRKIALKRSQELQALYYSFRGLLEGDKTTMLEYFEINFTAMDETLWVMELTPKSDATSNKLEAIEIWGTEEQVDTISTRSPNGNVQVTYLNHPEAIQKQLRPQNLQKP